MFVIRFLSPFSLLPVLMLGTAVWAEQLAAALTDAKIARFAEVARAESETTAELAQQKTQDARVKAFARRIADDSGADAARARPLLDRLASKTRDDFSDAIVDAAAQRRRSLEKLTGAAFDRRYAESEALYAMMIVGVLETSVLPATKDAQLKSHLDAQLRRFREQQQEAQKLLRGMP